MSQSHTSAALPIANGAVAEVVLGCPSAGGQRTNGLSHRTFPPRTVRPSEFGMAQGSVQRLAGHEGLVLWSFGCRRSFMQHRLPNPAVKRTVNGAAGSAGFTPAVPPLPSAYLQR
jgi:hypothetical protein